MGNLTAKTSGEIASFMSPSVTNIKSLKVHFSPKQLGTGDPSPENVRDIEGWGGVEVNYGKNLFDYSHDEIKYNYYRDNNGDEVYSATSFYTITSYPIQPNCKIFLHNDTDVFAVRIYFLTQDDQWISRTNWLSSTSKIITLDQRGIPSNCKKIQLHFTTSNPPVLNTFTLLVINNISYQWKLPDEYQEVEYIENTGTQYLLTDLIFRKDLENPKIEWKHMQIAEPTGDNMLFGYTATNGSVYFEYYSDVGRGYSGIGGIRYANIYYPSSLGLNEIAVCSIDKEKLILNETEFSPNNAYTDLTTVNPMSIFAWTNSNGTSGDYINKGVRIYYLRFYNGDTKMADFIPCYRKSDGEIGMYDTVSQTFYTNQGTGTFLKGEDVDKTFYGGYVDLISGELVEEWGMFTVDEPDSTWRVAAYNRITINFPRKYIFGSRLLKDKSMCTILPENHTDWNYGYIDNVASVTNPHALSLNYTGNGGGWSELFGKEATDENVKSCLQEIGFAICATLATPITHQLTPTQLKSFVGQNNFWSNADYVEVEYDLIETIDIQKAKQKIILNQPQLKTVSDKVVSFNTDMVAPMKNCKIYFNPIQLGTGDAFYTNVKDINGWTSIDSYVNGDKIGVDWANDAGTIYGGYLDLAKNEVVAEWIKYVFNRSSTVSTSGTSTLVEGLTWMTLRKTITSTPPYMSTPNNGDSYGFFTIGDWQKAAVGGKNRAFVNSKNLDVVLVSINGEDLTTSEGRSAFFDYIENNNIPIECVYKLATPIHYPLSSQQLLTLKSTNHIWSETNGQQIDVKYWTHKNLTPTPLTNYLENQTWSSNGYISATGKQTPDANSASHYLASPILLEAGTYVLSGFSHYVGSDNTRYRIHAYDSTGKWLRQITFQQIGNLSPVDISFTLDTDTYVNVSIAVDFDGVLAKIN